MTEERGWSPVANVSVRAVMISIVMEGGRYFDFELLGKRIIIGGGGVRGGGYKQRYDKWHGFRAAANPFVEVTTLL